MTNQKDNDSSRQIRCLADIRDQVEGSGDQTDLKTRRAVLHTAWAAPVVLSITLPAHAATSDFAPPRSGGGGGSPGGGDGEDEGENGGENGGVVEVD